MSKAGALAWCRRAMVLFSAMVAGCASVPVTPDRSTVTEGMVWEHYFKYYDRNPRPCRADEFPQYTGNYDPTPGNTFRNTRFDYLNGEWFFLPPGGQAKHIQLFLTRENDREADGKFWIALVDGATRRYWVVKCSGWGGERYEGPYSLDDR